MKSALRWPLHPEPQEGEALSSWLRRIAACYDMDARELLKHDLGHDLHDDLDVNPPMTLLRLLSRRSGVDLKRLRCMSLAGWVPSLFDSLDGSAPDALEAYAFKLTILLQDRSRATRSVAGWCAWRPDRPISRACPQCMDEQADQPMWLIWMLPLMLSCPRHGCWLEACWGLPGTFVDWRNRDTSPRSASAAIRNMDQRSWEALTTGHVRLPRQRVSAGLWFRLLRSLLEELNTPISRCGAGSRSLRVVWNHCGQPLRAGRQTWQPFEALELPAQLQMLEVAASAIDRIEAEAIRPLGTQAELFLPGPSAELTLDRLMRILRRKSGKGWQEAWKVVHDAIADAPHNPETARALYALASCGKRHDPVALERLRALFIEAQVPPEFLPLENSEALSALRSTCAQGLSLALRDLPLTDCLEPRLERAG